MGRRASKRRRDPCPPKILPNPDLAKNAGGSTRSNAKSASGSSKPALLRAKSSKTGAPIASTSAKSNAKKNNQPNRRLIYTQPRKIQAPGKPSMYLHSVIDSIHPRTKEVVKLATVSREVDATNDTRFHIDAEKFKISYGLTDEDLAKKKRPDDHFTVEGIYASGTESMVDGVKGKTWLTVKFAGEKGLDCIPSSDLAPTTQTDLYYTYILNHYFENERRVQNGEDPLEKYECWSGAHSRDVKYFNKNTGQSELADSDISDNESFYHDYCPRTKKVKKMKVKKDNLKRNGVLRGESFGYCNGKDFEPVEKVFLKD